MSLLAMGTDAMCGMFELCEPRHDVASVTGDVGLRARVGLPVLPRECQCDARIDRRDSNARMTVDGLCREAVFALHALVSFDLFVRDIARAQVPKLRQDLKYRASRGIGDYADRMSIEYSSAP